MISSSLPGIAGLEINADSAGSFRIASKMTADVSPRNGSVPVAISYNTTPKENRSVRESSSFPRACSGDMYATVPSADPGLVRCCSASIVAIVGLVPVPRLSRDFWPSQSPEPSRFHVWL